MNLENLSCIERISLTLAVSAALQNSKPLSFTEEMCLQCIERYREIVDASKDNTDTPSTAQLLLSAINKAYADNLTLVKTAFKYAHSGLVKSAIDGSLDSDANCWHLSDMADIGLALERDGSE